VGKFQRDRRLDGFMRDLLHSGDLKVEDAEFLKVGKWMTPSPFYIQAGQTVREAAEMIDKLRVDCLPIIDEEGQLVGMVTMRKVLHDFLHGKQGELVLNRIPQRNFAPVRSNESLLDIFSLPYEQFPVIDDEGQLIGVLSRRDILDGFFKYIQKLNKTENMAEVLQVILESAYEGIAVVDRHGIIREFNEAYSRFTGIAREQAIGRHVTEVIDNTNLHITVKTAIPERGVLQNIQGQQMIVHRIPIWKEEKVVGAIGMLIFEGVTEVYRIYERLQKDTMREQIKPQSFTTQKQQDSRITLDQIIGVSENASAVKRLARRAARTAATVLITGESGTGKEMYAKSIHHLSPFSSGPFISVNCGAIPDHLFESELFGYEEGAFTGAKKGGKPGKFELAHNGTLFLDEIGEMPLIMQTKLLRVLQEKEAERVGGIKKYDINVRIIAATNRNLKKMVEGGEFREDLFYRLNIIQLLIPPLRDRKEDIPILLSHYVKEICEKYQIEEKSITSEAVSHLMSYHWDGNIRELVNTIERLVTLVDRKIIDVHHLPDYMKESHSVNEKETKEEAIPLIERAKNLGKEQEKQLIIDILQKTHGNKSKAAEQLGIHRTTLYQKLKKYHIQ
jgi:transcriptional regulator with PAS, ATPase and Fis domain